jgi:hypothetical protein
LLEKVLDTADIVRESDFTRNLSLLLITSAMSRRYLRGQQFCVAFARSFGTCAQVNVFRFREPVLGNAPRYQQEWVTATFPLQCFVGIGKLRSQSFTCIALLTLKFSRKYPLPGKDITRQPRCEDHTSELPHLLEPPYRRRLGVAAQIQGIGCGTFGVQSHYQRK